MKLTIFLLFSILATSYCFSFMNIINEEWEAFKMQFRKKYRNPLEEAFRKKIYAENKHRIAQHNQNHYSGKFSFKNKMNEFGDMLPQEFFAQMNGLKYNSTLLKARRANIPNFVEPDSDITLPKSVDWRKKGAVTPIKNQGQCGSCWAFSSTGSLEGQHFRSTGKLVSLSEQNLIDCSAEEGNQGCNGGLMDDAFEYVKDNHGIDTEESYPYQGQDGFRCRYSAKTVGADDKGFSDIRQGSEKALKKAVAIIGPIAIAIDAAHDAFMTYSDGVYYNEDCSPEALDHGVLVVGYGSTKDGKDYWIVKNSWGTSWGESGYVKMARNRDNNCGVASQASYPLV